jgi:hypothetical protein
MRGEAAVRNRFRLQEGGGMVRLGSAVIASTAGAPAGSPGAAELTLHFVKQRPENENRDRGYGHG